MLVRVGWRTGVGMGGRHGTVVATESRGLEEIVEEADRKIAEEGTPCCNLGEEGMDCQTWLSVSMGGSRR
jgi:hypothetical protein